MLFHLVTNHDGKYLIVGTETGNWMIISLIGKSSVFGNTKVCLCISHPGILSGCSIHCLRHLNIALHVPVSFFHQKLCTLLIPRVDQLFRFSTALYNFFSVIMNPCTFLIFCPIFYATLFNHFLCGVLVLSAHIPTQNFSSFSILSTFPFSYFVPRVFL